MVAGDRYRAKAFELLARADGENDQTRKARFESLAAAFLRLAEQAEADVGFIIDFEMPPTKGVNRKPK